MTQIDKMINYLKEILLRMGDIVVSNILKSLDAFKHNERPDLVNDDVIDQYERLVEEICFDILIREKLFAGDLRQVVGILKLVSDFERIGDHAEDIATYNVPLNPPSPQASKNFAIMSDMVVTMIKDSIDSFIKSDIKKAEEVIALDDEVDRLFVELTDQLSKIKIENEEQQRSIVYNSFIVKYLERIADHATNICEWVIYIIKGTYKK